MCLIVEKNTEEKIAEEDIICYKRLDIYPRPDGTYRLVSLYQFFEYKLNVLYKTTFEPKELTSEVGRKSGVFYANRYATNYYSRFHFSKLKVYQHGFHSYKELDKENYYEEDSNVKCVIPAGTKYVEDKTGLICSEAIKIIEIL